LRDSHPGWILWLRRLATQVQEYRFKTKRKSELRE